MAGGAVVGGVAPATVVGVPETGAVVVVGSAGAGGAVVGGVDETCAERTWAVCWSLDFPDEINWEMVFGTA